MIIRTWRLLVAYCLLTNGPVIVTCLPPFGLQSGFARGSGGAGIFGNSFAGTMIFEETRNIVFITGATYSSFFDVSQVISDASTNSSCFLAIVHLPNTALDDPSIMYKERFGSDNVDESCSSLVVTNSKILVGGQSEEGGLLTSLRAPGHERAKQYGTVYDFDLDFQLEGPTTTNFLGGRLLDQTVVQSARAMVLDQAGDAIFVVSQQSDSEYKNPNFDDSENQPNLIDQQKWGGNDYLKVMKLTHKDSLTVPATTFRQTWEKEIATNKNPVDVAGIALVPSMSLLVVAGSTKGSNGLSIPSINTDQSAGFITLFDATNGTVMDAISIFNQEGRETRVTGLCQNPNRDDEIFLVGATNGNFNVEFYDQDELTAFLMRVTLPDLDISWTEQLVAKSTVESTILGSAEMVGYACGVIDDLVYIGGDITNGAVIDIDRHVSAGKDDIWVGLFNSTSQAFVWTRQIGTPDNEHLSALQVDDNGDVLVLGNSNGSFMRRKETGDVSTDIFLLRLSRLTGEYPVPTSEEFTGDNDDQTPTTSSPVATPTSPGVETDPNSSVTTISSDSGSGSAGVIAVVVVLFVTLGAALCVIYRRRYQSLHAETDSSHIERYVDGLRDVEIDLKHSASGGWHGTYVDYDGAPRGYSSGRMEDDDDFITFSGGEMSSLTHSAIVQDSLFSLDDEPDLNLGAVGRRDVHSRQSSYRGLVDVYNNYDLSHHRLPSTRQRAFVDININDDAEETRNSRWGREII